MIDAVVATSIILGALFLLVGSIGLVRLPDVLTRLHGPTKATTLGTGAIIIAAIIQRSVEAGTLVLHELPIALFLFVVAPISAHLIAKAAQHHDQ